MRSQFNTWAANATEEYSRLFTAASKSPELDLSDFSPALPPISNGMNVSPESGSPGNALASGGFSRTASTGIPQSPSQSSLSSRSEISQKRFSGRILHT